MDIVKYVFIFWAGLTIGFLLKAWLHAKLADYSGTILVSRDEEHEKLTYVLALDEDPEELQYMQEVVFKVEMSE